MTEQNHHSLTPADEAEVVAQIIAARQKRTRLFSPNLFADPAWDMILELFLAELKGQTLATSQLGHKANVPMTTSLRWIEKLEADGWVRRVPDAHDLRRVFVEISERGFDSMRAWLRDWPGHSSRRTGDVRVTDLLNRIGRGSS